MNSLYTYSQSLDDVCYLVSKKITYDEIGNQIKTPVEILCFCSKVSTHANEFFKAESQGLKSEFTLMIDTLSYNGETKVKYDDKYYIVHRCYGRTDGLTELYLIEGR